MGFLKFLKRDKKQGLDMNLGMDDLDVPPLPPDVKGESEEFPELPEMPKVEGPLPKGDEFPELPEEPKLFPDLPKQDISETAPRPAAEPVMPKPLLRPQATRPAFEQSTKRPMVERRVPIPPAAGAHTEHYDSIEESAVREQRGVISHKAAGGKTYVRIDRFKGILKDINQIKNDLRNSNEILSKVEEIDENKSKVFERWKNSMSDLQKKLIFVDKILFKGDANGNR